MEWPEGGAVLVIESDGPAERLMALPAAALALNFFFVLAAALPFALDLAVASAELFLVLPAVVAAVVVAIFAAPNGPCHSHLFRDRLRRRRSLPTRRR
jgi:hypothetical protein